MKILLVDNYDSFTYNLKSLLEKSGVEVDVVRNDKVNLYPIECADAFVFSPGPGIPSEAGEMNKLIRNFHTQKPMLGICLGMQGIGELFGARLELMDKPIHGFSSCIVHNEDQLFDGIEKQFDAGRYHSWVLAESSIHAPIEIIAKSTDDKVMAIKHQSLPIYGLQFHPESILTEIGERLISNFINEVKKYNYEKIAQ